MEAFAAMPRLRVEDLTAGDLDIYVRDRLLSHSRLQNQVSRDPELGERLIDIILSRACGVFLWVFLVVRSLCQRLTDGAYPEELETIIETYPPELHELYEHMFACMKPEHRLEAYILFQAISVATEVESAIPTALRFSYFQRDLPMESIKRPLNGISAEELQDRLSVLETLLRSRCCGLLELQQEVSSGSKKDKARSDEGCIAFIHRTVSDFLDDPGVRALLEQETKSYAFEINERLLASILHRLKSRDYYTIKTPEQWHTFTKEIAAFLVYCERCESRKAEYFPEFNKRLEQLWQL